LSQGLDAGVTTPPPSSPALPPVAMHFPFLSSAILAALCAIFVAEQLFAVTPPGLLWDVSVPTLHAMGGLSRNAVLQNGEWYRFFSAPLLHGDLMHLLLNGGSLIFAGLFLEHIIGRAWFGASYVVGGLTGAFGSFLLNKPEVVSVGASGAITGVFATLCIVSFLYTAKDRQRLQTNAMQLLVPAILPVLWKTSGNIDYWAHIGGALGGAALGLFLLKNWSSAMEPHLKSAAATVAVAGFVLAIATTIPVAQSYPSRVALIPENEIPKGLEEQKKQSKRLVAAYPHDPRGHLFRAFAHEHDIAAAEQDLRTALAEKDALRLLPPVWDSSAKALLKIILDARGNALAREGMFEPALAALDEAISIEFPPLEIKELQAVVDRANPHFHRGEIYLLKEDRTRAFQDFDEGIRRQPKNYHAYFSRGRAWLSVREFTLAVSDLQTALKLSPANDKDYAYYMLWMYLARTGAKELAKDDLASHAAKLLGKKWPYPIIDYYLGNITDVEMSAAAKTPEEKCEVSFYRGEQDLLTGKTDNAIPYLRTAREVCPKTFIEYTAAILELRKLGL